MTLTLHYKYLLYCIYIKRYKAKGQAITVGYGVLNHGYLFISLTLFRKKARVYIRTNLFRVRMGGGVHLSIMTNLSCVCPLKACSSAAANKLSASANGCSPDLPDPATPKDCFQAWFWSVWSSLLVRLLRGWTGIPGSSSRPNRSSSDGSSSSNAALFSSLSGILSPLLFSSSVLSSELPSSSSSSSSL